MPPSLTLTDDLALALLEGLSGCGPPAITPICQGNHVWRIGQGAQVFYLKAYTKEWYGDDIAATGACVAHEVAAWAALRRAGLAVPDVARAEEGVDNPLGRPFLLTRELRGEPLTAILGREGTLAPLAAVGAYLARAHAITFAFPGYISATGPSEPLRDGRWQHRCWSAAQRQRNALATFAATRALLAPATAARLEPLLHGMADTLAPAYLPPRFVHGDCHAHQFFVYREAASWVVSGVVDMEVSSAGDGGEDFLHLFSELSTLLPPATRWWEAFFDGYGDLPSFEALRLRFLGTSPTEYVWLAERGWGTDWDAIMKHFLDAATWEELLALAGR